MSDLVTAIAKLRWSSDGEWSASLKPQECRALLAVLPEHNLTIRTLDAKDPGGFTGEDDEQQ